MKKVPMIFFSIIYALLFGEAFVRIFSPVALMPRYVMAAPYGVRMNVPGADYWQKTPETQVNIRINQQGIRADHEYSIEKPAGMCRILMLGDSYFAGYEVDLEDSFAYLVEHKLQEQGYNCEIINLAVSGFGTAEMLATTEAVGLKYDPDIILFQWHGTDRSDNVRAAALYKENERGQLVRSEAKYLPGVSIRAWLSQFVVYRFLSDNSQFYSAIREAAGTRSKSLLAALGNSKKEEKTEEPNNEATPTNEEHFAETLSIKLLKTASHLSEMNHVKFMVLEIPTRNTRTDFASSLWLFSEKEREELNMLSPLKTFQEHASADKKIYYEKGHFHLTPWGNHLLTDYYIDELKASGWIDAFKK